MRNLHECHRCVFLWQFVKVLFVKINPELVSDTAASKICERFSFELNPLYRKSSLPLTRTESLCWWCWYGSLTLV